MSMQNKKITLMEELNRMGELAGIIRESDSDSDFSQARLIAGSGIILKLDSNSKKELESIEIPKEPNGSKMTKLPSDMLHITLTGLKNYSKVHDESKSMGSNIPMFIQNIRYYIDSPKVEFGGARFVYRDENENRAYSPSGKVSYVVPVKNQQDLRDYVNSIYDELGLANPEPNRFFHVTLANNMGGDSFKSIGNVSIEDFE